MMGPFYSDKYGTEYKVYVNINEGTWEVYNVTSNRTVLIESFNHKAKAWKRNLKAKIRSKLRKFVIKFELRIILKRSAVEHTS